jgi:hypothetical protein
MKVIKSTVQPIKVRTTYIEWPNGEYFVRLVAKEYLDEEGNTMEQWFPEIESRGLWDYDLAKSEEIFQCIREYHKNQTLNE